MNDQHPSGKAHTGSDDGVIVVGAGPVGCTAALLLADQGVPVTLLERHPSPIRCRTRSTSMTKSPGPCTAPASARNS
jgi:heterodisulfide reductase subunit A-like polyferredoxin